MVHRHMQRVLQRIQHRVINSEQNREGDQHGQAAACHTHAFLIVKLLGFLLQLQFIVSVDLLQLLDLFLQFGLGGHGALLLNGKGKQRQLHYQGEQQNGHAVVLHDLI